MKKTESSVNSAAIPHDGNGDGSAPIQITPDETVKHKVNPPVFSWVTFAFTLIALMSLSLFSTLRFTRWSSTEEIGESAIILAITLAVGFAQGVVVYPIYYLFRWLYYRFWQKKVIQEEIEQLQQDIQDDFFNNLVKINFKYIDKYYLQTQVQADKSFLLSCIAAIVSLIVVIVGISMMFLNKDNVTPSLVTTSAGVLGELISSVFFYLYTQTVIKMSEYHQKLVLTQNISLALKISDELDEPHKSEARTKLIDYLAQDINLYLSQSAKKNA